MRKAKSEAAATLKALDPTWDLDLAGKFMFICEERLAAPGRGEQTKRVVPFYTLDDGVTTEDPLNPHWFHYACKSRCRLLFTQEWKGWHKWLKLIHCMAHSWALEKKGRSWVRREETLLRLMAGFLSEPPSSGDIAVLVQWAAFAEKSEKMGLIKPTHTTGTVRSHQWEGGWLD